MITARWRVWAGIAAGVAVATACASPASDGGEAAGQEVNGARRSALGAIVALEGGCTAAKVGPNHLLVAARCVTNEPRIAIGKTLRFRKGDVTTDASDVVAAATTDAAAATTDAVAPDDAGSNDASSSDASTDDASTDDAAAQIPSTDAAAPGPIEAKIAQVQIHPTYLQKCGNGACALGKPGGADVADLAIIVLADEIADLPIAPIELDPVSAGTRVLAVGNGCDPSAAPRLRAKATEIAKTETAAHTGSPYPAEVALALAASYVTTRGPGDSEASGALVCGEKDLGAPLFLADGSAIVGVNSNTTPSSDARLPMTNQHARVDAAARHGVGEWLTQMGAKTSRACTDTDAGCKPLEAPAKADDAGKSSDAAAIPDARAAQPFTPREEGSAPDDESSADTTPSKPRKPPSPKKAADDGGCSAAPRSSAPGAGFGLLARAAAFALVRLRRRR